MLRICRIKVLILVTFCVATLNCHPIHKKDAYNDIMNVEMMLPNGTVVGKYNYTDNDGNPIEVKYYADDFSYGVELKSVKTQITPSRQPQFSTDFLSRFNDSHVLSRSPVNSEKYTKTNIQKKSTIQKTKHLSPTSDYEIFSHKEMKAPKLCANEKVRVYLNSDKRTVRKASEDATSQMRTYGEEYFDDVSKYCQQLV